MYDAIIIGGGFLGLSTAYHLANEGVKTLLLDAADIGGGTSASCSGRAQTCEGHLDPLNLRLILDGLHRLETLEIELDYDFEWRKSGLFLLVRTETSLKYWQDRVPSLNSSGIPVEIVDRRILQSAEPNMNTNGVMAAVYTKEGMINPLKFCRAYAAAAQRKGCEIRRNAPVIALHQKGSRISAVETQNQLYRADRVAIMAGAWSRQIAALAGAQIPIHFTHAEAIVTESLPPLVFNNIEIADFYETIHGKKRAVAIGVHPEPHGTIDVTEAVTQTNVLHRGVTAWATTSLAREMVHLYPVLSNARVIRSWGRPTSFTPDDEPIIGWISPFSNLYIAASLVETITAVPVLSEWMALAIQGKEAPLSLDQFSPSRFLNHH